MKRKLSVLTILISTLLVGCATAPNGQVGMTPQGKNALGTVVGAGMGGYLGSQVGNGNTRAVATVVGTIAGGAVGSVLTSPTVDNGYYGAGQSYQSQGQVSSSGYSYQPPNNQPVSSPQTQPTPSYAGYNY